MNEFTPVAVAFLVGAFMASMVWATCIATTTLPNRALSCMAAGNTVTQCQDVLGITPIKHAN